MPRDLDRLPRDELSEDLLLQLGRLATEPANLFDGLGALVGVGFELRDAIFQLVNRLLERQAVQSRARADSSSASRLLTA